MIILKDLSVLWSAAHTLIMFALLFESRYPRKKTFLLTMYTMVPLLLANVLLFLFVDTLGHAALLVTCVLPSFLFFWFLAKHRDGRFIFTFCLSDTLWLEILYITNILDFYLGNTYIFMFISRLIAYPLLEWFIYKTVRPIYFEVQRWISKGRYVFSAISAIFYVMMLLSMSHPTMIMERPEYLPAFVLQLILMPVVYTHIFITLRRQKQLHDTTQQENILQVQVTSLRSRIEEFTAAHDQHRQERHDFRHKLRTLAALAAKGDYGQLQQLAREYEKNLDEYTLDHYCSHPVLDAVLASYLTWARHKGITVTTALDFPEQLQVNESELATVFANALENAIHACEKLPQGERYLEIKVLCTPCFMVQIRNSFDGIIAFDENSIPISPQKGHGFGTRSIVTFCEKHDAFLSFVSHDTTFYLKIIFH